MPKSFWKKDHPLETVTNDQIEALTNKECIEIGVEAIKKYFEVLGLEQPDIDSSMYRLEKKADGNYGVLGYHVSGEDNPVVIYSDKKGEIPNIVKILVSIHEGFHYLADKVSKKENNFDKAVRIAKRFFNLNDYHVQEIGYSRNQIIFEDEVMLDAFFIGLNEAIVHVAALKAFELIAPDLKVDTKKMAELYPIYQDYIDAFLAFNKTFVGRYNAKLNSTHNNRKQLNPLTEERSINAWIKSQFREEGANKMLKLATRYFFRGELFMMTMLGATYSSDEISGIINQNLLSRLFKGSNYLRFMKDLNQLPSLIAKYFSEGNSLKSQELAQKILTMPGFKEYREEFDVLYSRNLLKRKFRISWPFMKD